MNNHMIPFNDASKITVRTQPLPSVLIAITCTLFAILSLATTHAHAVQLADQIYTLKNHPNGFAPGPNYGLRLDELIDLTPNEDVFTFNFNAPQSRMNMKISNNGTRIRIYGHAFGGYVVPNLVPENAIYDNTLSGVFNIDFTYDNGTQNVPGDDDLWVPSTHSMTNTGTISLNTEIWNLTDYADNRPYTFRIGDEDNDLGHWNTPDISAWGWLLLDRQPASTLILANQPNNPQPDTRNWLFTAIPSPEPITATLTTIAIGCIAMGMTRRRL